MRDVVAYSSYAVPLTATTVAITNFIPPLYSETFGLSLGIVGVALLSIRVIDALVDPLIGWAVDAAPFRQHHKPWILLAAPLYLLAVALLFFPVRAWVSPAYLLGVGGLAYMAFTLGGVPHQAWGAALASDERSLSRIFAYREVGVIAGILGLFICAAVAEHRFAGGAAAKAAAAGGFIFAAVAVFTLVCAALTPDRQGGAGHGRADWGRLRPFLTEPGFVRISLATLAYHGAATATSALGYFLARYAFDAGRAFALGLTITFLIAPLGMFVWMPLAKRIGDKNALVVACVAQCAVFLAVPVLSRLHLNGYYAYAVFLGLAFPAGPYLLRSLTGGLANDHERRTGERVRGTAFAVNNFFDKAGSGLGASALVIASGLGFAPAAAGHPAQGVGMLVLTAVLTTVTGYALAGVLVAGMRGQTKG